MVKLVTVFTFFSRTSKRGFSTRLAEVGVLEARKDGQYSVGQLFLHRIFGYRGVILFPWMAQVFDRDMPKVPHTRVNNSKDVTGVSSHYYQCLIDSRDTPHIRAQTESVTFLGSRESGRALYAIPGLDYVSHEDIQPYCASEFPPLKHELFDKFFSYTQSNEEGVGPILQTRETLKAWQEKNKAWLELSDVHRETTEGVRVTVIPFFIGSREMGNSTVYWWRYLIRLENLTQVPCQLRDRNWRIFSLSGTLETVQGRGVVGQEPVLSASQPAFQYTSHISLQSPSGHMWGTFKFERLQGSQSGASNFFEVRIPPFSLESREPMAPSPPKTSSPSFRNKHEPKGSRGSDDSGSTKNPPNRNPESSFPSEDSS